MFLLQEPQSQEICSKFLYTIFRKCGAGEYSIPRFSGTGGRMVWGNFVKKTERPEGDAVAAARREVIEREEGVL
jgi:hypothetical protein